MFCGLLLQFFSTSGNYILPLLLRPYSFFRSRKAPQGFLCLSLWDSECFYILSIVGSNNSLPISSESFPLSQEAAAPLSPCPGHSPNNPLLFSFNSFTEKLLKEPGSDQITNRKFSSRAGQISLLNPLYALEIIVFRFYNPEKSSSLFYLFYYFRKHPGGICQC